MRMGLSLIAGLVCCLAAAPGWAQSADDRLQVAQANPTPTAATEGEQDSAARVNNWTVGVAGGLLEGTFVRFAAELGKALDDGENLRVLPLISYGAAENVSDLLYLKGIDIAITDADVFEEFKKNQKYRNIDKRIHYISEMYVAEFHVYARPEIKSLKDLQGKKVGFNTKGSAANITGKIVFERLGIDVEPQFINHSIALEKMKTGEIAAIVHAVGKPNDLFKKQPEDAGFHFLPVEYGDVFADYYLPSVLQSEDYPNILKQGEVVKTIGVPVVLAVYNWPKGSDRFRRVERFIEYYFNRFDTLRQPPFHPKWREINLAAKIPGWTRYWVAEEMLARVASRSAPLKPPFTQETSSSLAVNPEEQQLFKEFLAWKKQQRR
jgi:TRAP-type uncharacterized transport system substrate-binding protein